MTWRPRTFARARAFVPLAILCGCASALEIRSNPPGADVFALTDKGERGQSLGQTPFKLAAGGARSLEVAKSGFLSTYVFAPDGGSGEDHVLTVNLLAVSRSLLESLVKEKHPAILDEAAYDLLELQNATLQGRESEVGAIVRKLESRYVKFVTYNLILGNHHFVRKDFKKSREYYERALQLDPGNKDAKAMIKVLGASRY